MTTTVLVAGSTGMLGNRIARHLLDQPDTGVRLLLRPSAPGDGGKHGAADALISRGAVAVTGDVTDPASLDPATAGADVVVSALQGGPAVIVGGQVALAESAVRNGARRFIPSDFAIDLFKAPAGAPQFDMRRQADEIIDALPLEVVHVLNGAFMDMMLDPNTAGIIDLNSATATLWGTGEEPFNLTTFDDTARFTARIATDPANLAGVRYVSCAETTFNAIIDESERLSGKTLTRTTLGSAETSAGPPETRATPGQWSGSGTSCRCSPSRPSPPPTTTATPMPARPDGASTSPRPITTSTSPDPARNNHDPAHA